MPCRQNPDEQGRHVDFCCSGDPIPDWPRALQANESDVKGKDKASEPFEMKEEAEDMDLDEQVRFTLSSNLAVWLCTLEPGFD